MWSCFFSVRYCSHALILTLFVSVPALGQTLIVTREDVAYKPDKKFDPASLMASSQFNAIASGQYIVVEGYIDCLGSKWPEDDEDYHFELQSTKAKRGPGVSPNSLVCEINPTLQLTNSAALKAFKRHDPSTYRKVCVFGFLRFGAEKASHSGIHTYSLGDGKTIKGHWEIHPVEKVVSIDNGPKFQIGPVAKYVKPVISDRYSLRDVKFEHQTASNYGALRGTVKSIKPSLNGSGDYDVRLEVNSTMYTATIPQYYVQAFDPSTQMVSLIQLPTFSSIHNSLKPSDSTQRTFYGDCEIGHFSTGKPAPALQPVEMIK